MSLEKSRECLDGLITIFLTKITCLNKFLRSMKFNVPDTNKDSETNHRKMNLIKTYSLGITVPKNEDTTRALTKAVRKLIVPKIKFVGNGKMFGSFEQPDFSHPECWVNKVFSTVPSIDGLSDRKKAEMWMTYRKNVKEQFSLHRSGVTIKIKNKFLNGKRSIGLIDMS